MQTLEQQAIEKFLAQPAKTYGSGGCACMGPQPIPNFKMVEDPYSLELINSDLRSKFIIKVHKKFDVSMAQAKEMVDDKKVGFDNPYICKRFKEDLEEQGVLTEIIKKPTGVYPECGCRMDNMIEVNNIYFRVEQNSSLDNKQWTATYIGPVGGPYQNIDWLKF